MFPYHGKAFLTKSAAKPGDIENRDLILRFKAGDPAAMRTLLPFFIRLIETGFGKLSPRVTLICVPSDSFMKDCRRHTCFSSEPCRATRMQNRLKHVRVVNQSFLAYCPAVVYYKDFFSGRFVFLFDDVIASNSTMRKATAELIQAGVHPIGGIAAGRAVRVRRVKLLQAAVTRDDAWLAGLTA